MAAPFDRSNPPLTAYCEICHTPLTRDEKPTIFVTGESAVRHPVYLFRHPRNDPFTRACENAHVTIPLIPPSSPRY